MKKSLYKLKLSKPITINNIIIKENSDIYIEDNPLKDYITQEMIDWYHERTYKHIGLVQKYCRIIQEKFGDEFIGLIENGRYHDELKLKEPEYSPYILITWDYYCNDHNMKFDLPDEIRKNLYQATEHHVLNSKHHPEYWQDRRDNILDINSRDGTTIPNGIIDATKMPDIRIGEMCADWMSMSEERGGKPQDWADKTINVRWKFNPYQVDLIYKILNIVWE